jgi:translation elongation factor EF-G
MLACVASPLSSLLLTGIVLVVDVNEGPMSQTKFVLGKAIQHKLKPLVVINKVGREGRASRSRPRAESKGVYRWIAPVVGSRRWRTRFLT